MAYNGLQGSAFTHVHPKPGYGPQGSYGKCLLLTVEKTEGVLGEVLAIARGIP